MEITKDIQDQLRQEILNWDSDFKAENFAAYLISAGLDSEQIIFQPQGTYKRSFRKEVSGFFTDVAGYENTHYLYLQINRSSLYDALPEGIFHQPVNGRTEKNKYETIAEIRKHKEEEAEARKFFLPFEHGFNNLKTLLHLFEQDFEKHEGNSRLIGLFTDQWPVLNKLDTFHAYVFLRLIPLIHCIRNDFALVSDCLEMITGDTFTLEPFLPEEKDLFYSKGSELGFGVLGESLVTGGPVRDGDFELRLTVYPSQNQRIIFYTPSGPARELLLELLDYFVGVNYNVHIVIHTPEAERDIFLEKNTVLGFNSYL